MNKQLTSTSRLCLLGLTLLFTVLLPGSTMAIPASPGDGDNDGIITGPRLVGGTVFRGCFASGPDPSGAADPDWDKDVDTITGALKGTGSWQDANMTKLKNGKRADIETCVNAAKGTAQPGDEFIFYFSGHGGNYTFQDGVKDQHETAADPKDEPDSFDNHILLGDATAGTRSRMSDDELAKLLSGFKQSVTIVVILDSCNSHTFTDGSADLGSVTQKNPTGKDVPATSHLALIAASTAANPTCSAGMTDRIADGLKSLGDHPKADKNKDGVVTAKEAADHAKAYLPELKPKCDEAEPFVCPMPEEPGAIYRGPLPPDVDNCPTAPNTDQMDTDGDYYGDVCDDDDDGDGLTDVQETGQYKTDPLKPDTDDDRMPDGYEVRFPCLEPLEADNLADSDGDGMPNGIEHQYGTDPCTPGSGSDFGDAPEGGLAYPTLGVVGAFPTCKSVLPASFVQHGLGWAHFKWVGATQLPWDAEPDGNAGQCPNCFPPYDADECYRDGDAGLMFPQPYTIDNFMNVTTCPNSLGTALGTTCQMATWGGNADIFVVNNMPVVGYVNVLMDWNQNGRWGGVTACPGAPSATEHVLVDWPVPVKYNGPLSGLQPPGFMIGPNAGYVWARFSITPKWVGADWPGEDMFEDGESEDYLLEIEMPGGEPRHDLGDAPDSSNNAGLPMTAYPPGGPAGTQALFPTVYQTGSPPYGPIHLQPQTVAFLGPAVTLENEADVGPDQDGVNNIAPGADNPDQDQQDDGVIFPLRLPHCVPTTFQFTVTVVDPSKPMYVNAWFDWSRDGEWDDTLRCGQQTPAPEWAVPNMAVAFATPGTYTLTSSAFLPFNPLATEPNPLWMRILLSEQRWSGGSGVAGEGGAGIQGGYQYGETEDYYVERYLSALDWGDAPDGAAAPGYPTLLPNNGARHFIIPGGPFMGAALDAEPDGQPDPAAMGDDNNGVPDDEDGVTIRGPWVIGQTARASVDMRWSPAGCYLNAWVDFNANRSWLDPNEQIAADRWLSAGSIHDVSFSVPSINAAVPGITYARFRCSGRTTSLGPAGEALDGEVEDYRVELLAPPKPPVVTASRISLTTLRLSWPKVTQTIYNTPRLADGYRIYWNASPYWTPAPGSQWMSLWEPGLPDPVTQNAIHLGDPNAHHFYIVRAVYRDIDMNELESAGSNRTGEFEFWLVPGSP